MISIREGAREIANASPEDLAVTFGKRGAHVRHQAQQLLGLDDKRKKRKGDKKQQKVARRKNRGR